MTDVMLLFPNDKKRIKATLPIEPKVGMHIWAYDDDTPDPEDLVDLGTVQEIRAVVGESFLRVFLE